MYTQNEFEWCKVKWKYDIIPNFHKNQEPAMACNQQKTAHSFTASFSTFSSVSGSVGFPSKKTKKSHPGNPIPLKRLRNSKQSIFQSSPQDHGSNHNSSPKTITAIVRKEKLSPLPPCCTPTLKGDSISALRLILHPVENFRNNGMFGWTLVTALYLAYKPLKNYGSCVSWMVQTRTPKETPAFVSVRLRQQNLGV